MFFNENIALFIIFFNLIPVIAGAAIAEHQNRSRNKAALLCLFTGWFGVLAVAALEKRKLCVECQNAIPAKALICSYCGFDIRERRRKNSDKETLPSEESVK